ncbi:MAG TPA: carboxypeptidase-like regulatory domain-containing protein [Fimbriimonas sp.]|nr:carboxypeptidase-like regulatory domain-containing protein [Fimbriimonas sp.]
MDSTAQVVYSRGGAAQTLLQMGRDDPNQRLLGPLRASHFAFGNLVFSPVPLLTDTRIGSGLMISNRADFGNPDSGESITGGSAPDSSVELYSGDELLQATQTDPSGRYEFKKLPLYPGGNRFLISTVGSDGKVGLKNVWVYSNPSLPKPHHVSYEVSADRDSSNQVWSGLQGEPRDRSLCVAQSAYGLSKNLWVTQTSALVSDSAGSHGSLGFGLEGSFSAFFAHVDQLLTDSRQGALAVGISHSIGGQSISLDRIQASPYPAFPNSGVAAPVSTGTLLSWQRLGRQSSTMFGIEKADAPDPATYLIGRYSAQVGPSFLTDFTRASFDHGFQSLDGELSWEWLFRRSYSVRLDSNYAYGRALGFGPQSLTLSRSLPSQFVANFTLLYSNGVGQRLHPMATLFKLVGPLALGVTLSGDGTGHFRTGLALSTSISALGGLASARFERPGSAALGKLRARFFVDKVGDGRFHSGDPLVAGVGVLVDGHGTEPRSQRNGVLGVASLPPGLDCRVSVDSATIADPCLVPETPAVLVCARAGREARVDFPLVETSDLTGRFVDFKPVSDAPLKAVLLKGDVPVGESVLDDGGTYVFSGVPPGEYELRIETGGEVLGSEKVVVGPGKSTVIRDVRSTR